MADEKEEVESTDEEAKPGKLKFVLFAIAGLVLLAAGVGVGFVLGGSSPDDSPTTLEAEAGDEGHSAEVEDGHGDEESEHAEPAADEHGGGSDGAILGTYKLDSFIANIADRDRDRFLKLRVELELNNERVEEELDQRLPHIRDIVISLLGSKSFEEVRSIEGKDLLREEMLQRINSLLGTGKVRRIFFTEFIVQ